MTKRVGILTWHYYENVGSNLQAYALMKNIEKCGYDVKFINYQQKKLHDSQIKKCMKIFLSNINKRIPGLLPQKYTFKSFNFQKKYFRTTKTILNNEKLKEMNNLFDIFVCGSDQIWSPIVFDSHYFLDFVEDKYKFSYAPSIGCNYIPNSLKSQYIELISKFDGISIREEKGKELLKELNIDAKVVLDPTFLLTKDEWLQISSGRLENEKYIFCYFLGQNKKSRNRILKYAKSTNKKLIIYSAFKEDVLYCDERVYKIGPEEFISYINYADAVFTDSFHGVIFSLKFEKNFNAFYRFKENDKNNQNSRIINILEKFNLNNKLIAEDKELEMTQIDYKIINSKMNFLVEDSFMYLKGELQNGSES